VIFEKQFWLTNKKDTPSNKSANLQHRKTNLQLLDSTKTKNRDPAAKKTWFTQKKNRPQKLCQYIEEHPDACLKELAKQFNCKTSSMHNAIVKLKIARKKNHLPAVKNQKPTGKFS
jgi:predicted HTH transcriptional regulator